MKYFVLNPKTYFLEGSRSFIVHMMDDHGLTEKEATELFQKQNSIRKRKSLSILHDQIEIKKIKVREEICQKKYNFLV